MANRSKATRAAFLKGARTTCDTDDGLHSWVELYCGLHVPRTRVCPHHDAPFEYLKRAYFEPAEDLVVWAPRGGGKTRLGAVATLLDVLHKSGVSVRIIGGSFLQSLRMWEHLLPDLEHNVNSLLVKHRAGKHSVTLSSGSTAAVLTQSQRAVRGLRVQKLRCDEVELFDPDVWAAAQLVTKSMKAPDGAIVRGSVEALSTFHKAYGLMADVIDKSKRAGSGVRVLQWCILDVLEKCPPERECGGCALHDDCRGVAKTRCDGFFSIDDAIAIKRRSSVETWEAEMLCKRPSQKGCVFRTFDESMHVCGSDGVGSDGVGSDGVTEWKKTPDVFTPSPVHPVTPSPRHLLCPLRWTSVTPRPSYASGSSVDRPGTSTSSMSTCRSSARSTSISITSKGGAGGK